jgi:hypothetical protein
VRQEVSICLDEIDVCYDQIENGRLSGDKISKLKGWARRQKENLKEFGYNGNFRRLKRTSS